MKPFRRLASLLSLVLMALIVVQTTDLVRCADEAEGVSHEGGYHVDGVVVAGAHPALGGDHDDRAPHEEAPGMADCLCHVTFTPTEVVPEVASAPAAPPIPFAPYLAHVASVEVRPLDHVPLA